jgi:hypothetical protein
MIFLKGISWWFSNFLTMIGSMKGYDIMGKKNPRD